VISLTVAVPFSYGYSKNRIYRYSRRGIYKNEVGTALRDGLAWQIRVELSQHKNIVFRPHKVYLDILVQKPDMRDDAINVLDLFADAIKDAIGVDDRWFSIRRLDWEIKRGGNIYLTISQEVLHDRRNHDDPAKRG
jgi:hypothetical protein